MFQIGDKVRRRDKYQNYIWAEECELQGVNPHKVFVVENVFHDETALSLVGFGDWDADKFELAIAPETFNEEDWL